jgi:hypothetical protein
MIIYSNPSFLRSRKIIAIYKEEMLLVCHQNRNGSTRAITNSEEAIPLLFLRVTISVIPPYIPHLRASLT